MITIRVYEVNFRREAFLQSSSDSDLSQLNYEDRFNFELELVQGGSESFEELSKISNSETTMFLDIGIFEYRVERMPFFFCFGQLSE